MAYTIKALQNKTRLNFAASIKKENDFEKYKIILLFLESLQNTINSELNRS